MPQEPKVYVREKRPGSYELRAYLGTDEEGKPLFRHATVKGDEKEARARARELEAAILRGEEPGLSADLFGGFCDQYLARAESEGSIELSTLRGYRTCRKRITGKLNKKPLDKITPSDLERFLEGLLKKGLSPTTALNTHRFIHLVLERAERLELLVRNPASKVTPPKVERKQRREVDLFDDDFDLEDEAESEVSTIPREIVLELVDSFDNPTGLMKGNPCIAAAFFTAYATGLRRGELLALTWKSIDLEAGVLHVRRAVYWPHGVEKPVVKSPKTSSGRRTITLSPATVARLRAWRRLLSEICLAAGRPMTPLVFPNIDTLSIYRPDTISNAFRTRMKWLGHEGAGSLHSLRHTHASELLSAREPIHVVSKRLGHADVATTLRVYAHAIPGSDASVASRIDEVLGL